MGMPDINSLKKELKRTIHNKNYRKNIGRAVQALLCLFALLVIVYAFFVPVLKVKKAYMQPYMQEGDIVVGLCTGQYKQGDIIAFYFGKDILIKRVAAAAGDTVSIDEYGNVYVNEQMLDEPYIQKKEAGESDISFPYRVPDGELFVLNDERNVSLDSRSSEIGCIDKKDVIGKLLWRIYPFHHAGLLQQPEQEKDGGS